MEVLIETAGVTAGLTGLWRKVAFALGDYGKAAGARLEKRAKNPPFPYKPERVYTEKEMIMFKSMAKRGRLKMRKRESGEGGPFKWRDRSGEARKSIVGGIAWDGPKLEIYVCGGTEHNVYLELANEKRFAALAPAVEALAGEIMDGLGGMMDRL